MRICFLIALLAATLFSGAGYSQETHKPPSPTDFIEMPRLGNAALSPDGALLLYTRTKTDWDINRIVKRYRLYDVASGATTDILPPEKDRESFGSAIWAPDSSGFITLLEREDDKADQAYFYDVATQTLARLSDHPVDIESIIWAPDGQSFYFISAHIQNEEDQFLADEDWVIPAYDNPDLQALWRFNRVDGAITRILFGAYSVRSYSLSRDGTKIVYARADDQIRDRRHRADLWLYDVITAEHSRLTDNDYAEYSAKLSPDNQAVAYVATVNARGEQYYEDNLFVHYVGEDTPELLMPKQAMEVVAFEWDRGGNGIFVLGNVGLRTELFHYDMASRELHQLTDGQHVVKDWSYNAASGTHTAIIQTAQTPGEIHVMAPEDNGFRALTNEYGDWRMRFALPRQEAVRWKSRGGAVVEGLLVYPVGYQESEKYPLVTITHGGPRSSSQFGSWNTSRYVSVLTGQGYAVFLPNHRGGTGYGDAFMRDMVGGYFRNAHHDVLSGIDHLVDRGIADPDRLIKMGWSAGGHMTNKLITFTDRFKAASSGAGVADWVSMYGESDVRHNRTPWFGGTPWQRRAPLRKFRKDSPLKDTWKVSTPTLFFSGEDDVRVPPTQNIMMYRALRDAGVETRLYIADDEPHNYKRPANQLFKINTELAWYARHVLGETFDPLMPPEANLAAQTKAPEVAAD